MMILNVSWNSYQNRVKIEEIDTDRADAASAAEKRYYDI